MPCTQKWLLLSFPSFYTEYDSVNNSYPLEESILVNNTYLILGLDPAGPLFESQDARARLDSSDAVFVDVIHSNGENLIYGGLGSWQPMGHVDFYPNGGRMQKGCTNLFVGAVSDIIFCKFCSSRS